MFAVLHVASFGLQAVVRLEPDLASRSVALLSIDRKKAVVLEMSPAAAAAGIEPGLTATQAMARCATVVLRTVSPSAEAEARQALLACGFDLSPLVEDTAPGICTVDLAGAAPASRSAACRSALAQLTRFGLAATAGLARTPWLALLAARARSQCHLIDDTVRAPHSGVCHVIRDKLREEPSANLLVVEAEREFLRDLPLAAAEPSPELAEILAGWGIHTLGQLTALPKPEIARRLGAEGVALWERAAGEITRPLQSIAPPRTFEAHHDFEHEVETLEPLLFILRRFVDRLTLDLRSASLVSAELALVLALADESRHERRFRLPEPTGDPDILFRALHTHLESLHTASPVRAVALRIEPARPLGKQQDLFATGLRDPHGFAETLARAVAVAGSGRVGTPRLEGTHRPDAVVMEPPAAVVSPPASPAVHPPLGLPLRRFRPPLPAQIELTDRRPTFIRAAAVDGKIVARRGPWRASGDWWQPDFAWSRLEWDVELAGGGLYRLIQTTAGWFIEGEYD